MKIFGHNRRIAKILFAGLIALTSVSGCLKDSRTDSGTDELILGTPLATNSAIVLVADHYNFFAKNNLHVTFQPFQAGINSAEALLRGEIDLALMSDFVVASKISQSPQLRIFASICRSSEVKVIALHESGIKRLSEIKGKKIGVMSGTSAWFYLNLILITERIPASGIEIVNLNPSEQLQALKHGTVDAIIVWEPHATNAIKIVGPNGFVANGQTDLSMYWLVVGTEEILSKKSRALEKFLRSLVEAQKFVLNENKKTLDLTARSLGVDPLDLNRMWDNFVFDVSIDRPLLKTLELQQRWSKSLDNNKEFEPTNFVKVIESSPLSKIDPSSVTLMEPSVK